MKSALFTLERFVPAEKFGVDLREFFQAFPKLLIGRDPLLTVLLLGRSFKQELQDLPLSQAAHQIVEGSVFLSLSTGAVGFATRGETFHVGSAQQMRRNGELAQESGLAVAQGQGRSAAKFIYLSQVLG